MPDIEIHDEIWNKLKEFKKVAESILEDGSIKMDEDYIELVLKLGIEKMIRDLLPNDESILIRDLVNMFNENPKYISEHILDNLERGKESEETEQVKKDWSQYA